MGYFKTLNACTWRYLKIDWRYKFSIVTDAIWTMVTVVAFGTLGYAAGQGNENFVKYQGTNAFIWILVTGIFYWTFFSRPFEESVLAVPEEAARGTLGFLVTNQVSPATMLTGRMVSSVFKFTIIAAAVVYPVMYVLDLRVPPEYLLEIFLILFISMFFMLALVFIVSALTLIVKKIGVIINIFLHSSRILSGFYFPLSNGKESEFGPVAMWIENYLPIARGLVMIRDIVIPEDKGGGISHTAVWEGLEWMLIGTVIALVFAFIFIAKITDLSRKWGTLEFY
ncbi:MAG: ABC transporter permease [Candidatus Wukongarchaeota archaeon]|nr:ABC transporter permease [Candidatus Wukongarchaeota archaeon]MDO8129356.1 ABC transporter permease [Candidatus Wukongarchaeota archaeon]